MAFIRGDNDSAIVTGRVIRNAECKEVKGYKITKIPVSTGKDAPVITCTLWGDMALGYSGLPKNSHILASGTVSSHEFNGKRYLELNVDYISVQDAVKLAPVKEEDPFATLSSEAELPF